MKSIAWLIAFSLAAVSLRAQSVSPAEAATIWSEKNQTEVPRSAYNKSIAIDTNTYCFAERPKKIEKRCDLSWDGSGRAYSSKPSVSYMRRSPYVYNFRAHISGSAGIKLSEMSISKMRLEAEFDTRTDHWTAGALLSAYTLQYYYTGLRAEAFARFYFVENTSGEGAFIQARIGAGKFWNSKDSKDSFGGAGFGADIGKKFIIIGNDRDYSNSFTMTPMGGIQAYPGPDGSIPISWVWQLRFGYQFGGGRR